MLCVALEIITKWRRNSCDINGGAGSLVKQ